jgi:hypothetical protein
MESQVQALGGGGLADRRAAGLVEALQGVGRHVDLTVDIADVVVGGPSDRVLHGQLSPDINSNAVS